MTPRRLAPDEDTTLLRYGLGVTNLVGRPSAGEGDLTWAEFVAGAARLRQDVAAWQPRVVACLGKNVARGYADLGRSAPVAWGPVPTPAPLPAPAFAVPNPSARSTLAYADRLSAFRELRAFAGCDTGRD